VGSIVPIYHDGRKGTSELNLRFLCFKFGKSKVENKSPNNHDKVRSLSG